VIAAITASTAGSREVIASQLSRLICAMPVICTCWPPRPVTACNRSNWISEASETSGAVLPTVKNALPSLIAAAVDDVGPPSEPRTNVPPGADTDDTSRTWDSCAA
jgi:hypothetical protein